MSETTIETMLVGGGPVDLAPGLIAEVLEATKGAGVGILAIIDKTKEPWSQFSVAFTCDLGRAKWEEITKRMEQALRRGEAKGG